MKKEKCCGNCANAIRYKDKVYCELKEDDGPIEKEQTCEQWVGRVFLF